MQRSNSYIIIFTVALTVICAGLLAGVAEALKPEHKKQIELDTKSKILGAVMPVPEKDKVMEVYGKRIQGIVVNAQGEEVQGVEAEKVNTLAEYKKKKVSDKLFPVFKFMSEDGSGKVEAYILPMYGNGLWDLVSGFMAVEGDLSTVKGAVFDHVGETPGLGARITDNEGNTGDPTAFQERFKGRSIVDASGNYGGLTILKGEKNKIPESDKQSVDGLSGASMTTGGVNKMLTDYIGHYANYFKKIKQ